MSRTLLRSVLELRAPLSRPLSSAHLFPVIPFEARRSFNTTSPIIDPVPQDASPAPRPQPRQAPTRPTPIPTGPLSESVRELLPLLRAQPSHYITVHIHARPYLVTEGDAIRLPFHMPGVLPGDVLRLTHASVLGSRDLTLKGGPWVDPRLFECRAVVLGVESEPLRFKEKTKRRNRKTKTVRSKHHYTVLRVSELKVRAVEEVEGQDRPAETQPEAERKETLE